MAVHDSSGNVFADLGLPDPEEHLAKAEVAICIDQLIKERGVTQADAAAIMGVKQSDVSKITRGLLRGYTLERLLHCLTALDQDVEIVIRPKREDHGRISVATA